MVTILHMIDLFLCTALAENVGASTGITINS